MKAFLSNEITQAAFLSPLKISASAKHLRYLNAKAHDVFISLCKLSQSKLTNTPARFNFSLYYRAIQRDLGLNKNFRSDVIKSLASLQKLTIILNGSTKVKTRIFKTLEIKKRVFRFTLMSAFKKALEYKNINFSILDLKRLTHLRSPHAKRLYSYLCSFSKSSVRLSPHALLRLFNDEIFNYKLMRQKVFRSIKALAAIGLDFIPRFDDDKNLILRRAA